MAAIDATTFPVNGQAYRLYGWVKSVLTGEVITGGLGTLAGSITKDGGASAATTNTPTEIGTTGCFYLDLTAAEMTANAVCIRVTSTATDSMDVTLVLPTLDLSVTTTNAHAQSVKKLEQYIMQTWGYSICRVVYDYTNSSVEMLQPGSVNAWLDATITGSPNTDKPELT